MRSRTTTQLATGVGTCHESARRGRIVTENLQPIGRGRDQAGRRRRSGHDHAGACDTPSTPAAGRRRIVGVMPVVVLRLKAPRPRFAQTLTDAEREIMGRHAAHWRPYVERGDMVAVGPVLTDDDSYGLAVVETDDEQALRSFAATDPVVTTGTASFEIGRLADLGIVRTRS